MTYYFFGGFGLLKSNNNYLGVRDLSSLTDEQLNSYSKSELIEYIRELENISSDLQVNDQLEEQRKRVAESEKYASLGVLAAGIGHEINNPLGVIKGMSFFINKKIKELQDSESLQRLSVIDECVSRISDIVDGLRTMARSDTHHHDPFNSHEYLKKSVGIIRELYRKEGVNITLQLNAEKPCFVGNIGKFQQICMNMLSNARDAINESGKEVGEITIKSWNDEGYIYYEFKDNGCGIQHDNLVKVFDAFFTTKEVGKGTGMGLSITCSLINDMKGEIKVDSTFGEGSTFRIMFPLIDSEPSEPVDSTCEKANYDMGALSGKVLIADDEELLREVVVSILEDFGIEVHTACDGRDALEKIKDEKFDLIITDLKMPRICGEELMRRVKNDDPDLDIIVITGGVTTDFSQESRNYLQENASGVIKKPFEIEDIHKTLKKFLKSA